MRKLVTRLSLNCKIVIRVRNISLFRHSLEIRNLRSITVTFLNLLFVNNVWGHGGVKSEGKARTFGLDWKTIWLNRIRFLNQNKLISKSKVRRFHFSRTTWRKVLVLFYRNVRWNSIGLPHFKSMMYSSFSEILVCVFGLRQCWQINSEREYHIVCCIIIAVWWPLAILLIDCYINLEKLKRGEYLKSFPSNLIKRN